MQIYNLGQTIIFSIDLINCNYGIVIITIQCSCFVLVFFLKYKNLSSKVRNNNYYALMFVSVH